MIESANQKQPVIKILALSLLALFTAFLFACENDLDSFENKDTGFQYEFSEADLNEEIKNTLKLLENGPQDLIDKYIEEQRKHPEYLYMPGTMWTSEEDGLQPWTPEKIKAGVKLGPIDFEIPYYRELQADEINSVFEEEMISKMKIIGGFAIIRRVDRLKYMEYNYKTNSQDAQIHDDYDIPAQFKGGMEALARHLKENLKYPEIASKAGIEDKLYMRFVVTKTGGLVYLNIEKEPETLNEEVSLEFQKAAFEALRSSEGMWLPAEKDGKYVLTKMILPIEFSLKNK
jgi:hypothetical protein